MNESMIKDYEIVENKERRLSSSKSKSLWPTTLDWMIFILIDVILQDKFY